MAKEAFNFIQKWKHLGEKDFTELFLKEVPKFCLRPLERYRQSVHFESTHKVDNVAVKLQLGLPTDCIPIQNSGAGDCLFKAISQSLYGVEDHHREIRLKVFVWMIENKDAVLQIREKYIHFTFESVFSLTMQVGTPQEWMGVAHIACSAMALGIHIHTFYPYVNGLEDTTATLLNTIYNCKAYGNEVSIIIQWSSITFDTYKDWRPNHFVSLVNKTKQNFNFKISERRIIIVDSDDKDSDDFINASVNVDSSLSESLFKTVNSKIQNKAQATYSSDSSDDFVDNVNGKKKNMGNFYNTKHILQPIKRKNQNSSCNDQQPKLKINVDNNDIVKNIDGLYVKPYTQIKRQKDIFKILEKCDKVLDTVPKIIKSNVQFVLNMNNYYFPDSKKLFRFYDDCGEWDYKSKNYKVSFFQKSGFTKVSKKCSVESLEKPKECDLIKIIRYRIKHSLDKNFIRWITFAISKEFKRALFQYKGTQPLSCKKIRVDPMSIKKVKVDVNLKSKKIKNSIDDPILSTKSIKNVKYRVNNKHKDFKEKNIANDLENCLKKVGDGYVQSIKIFKDPLLVNVHQNLPSFILFTEDQFVDMVTCSAQLGSVLSVDRTFNLGTYFLTLITFKNKKVTFRDNISNPVFLGPCFLHKKAKEEDYNFFFLFYNQKF